MAFLNICSCVRIIIVIIVIIIVIIIMFEAYS